MLKLISPSIIPNRYLLLGLLLLSLTPTTPLWASRQNMPFATKQQKMLIKMGETTMGRLHRGGHLISDAIIEDYLETLQNKISAENDLGTLEPAVLVNNPEFNAFALPGGFMGVHSGLIDFVHTEDELAAVLSHEIAHVESRHIERMMNKAKEINIGSLAMMVGAMAIGSVNPEAGMAAASATMAAAQESAIHYTKQHEKEADRIGIRFMAHAGFNPVGMAKVFERMQLARRYDSKPPSFLQTHPLYTSRIADAMNHARNFSERFLPKDPLLFRLIKTRMHALMKRDHKKAIANYQAKLKKHPNNAVALYGLGLTYLIEDQIRAAKPYLLKLNSLHPEAAIYQLALADYYLHANQAEKACKVLKKSFKWHDQYYPLVVSYSQALIKAKHYNQAITILSQYLNNHSERPVIYQLLAKAQNGAGFKAESHQNLAEYYHLSFDDNAALAQLKIAKRMTKDEYLKAAIDNKITGLRES